MLVTWPSWVAADDCRAAEKRHELAALHSITSSARASSVDGTSRPSALAVLRLMTSSVPHPPVQPVALAQNDRGHLHSTIASSDLGIIYSESNFFGH
jgi:hypothetical protein